MKKLTFLLLSLTLCFSLVFGSISQAAVITVDGNEVKQVNHSGTPVPEVEGNLVPIRAVLNAMGYTIAYDNETGLVSGGTFADPEFVFTPGEEGSVLVDGTTFVEADMLANVLPFTLEIDDAGIAYTNTFSEMTEGWYHINLNGRYLTAQTLPENDLVETVTKDDGTTEERGARLTLSDDDAISVWYINKLPNNVSCITNTANDFAIDISGVSMDEGAAALTYTLSRNANQMWLIIENENGTVSLQAQHSNLYLAVDEDGKAIQSETKYEWTLEAID